MNEIVKTFQTKRVRIIIQDDKEWFVAKDVCDILGIVNSRDALSDFPNTEKSNVASNDLRELGFETGNRGLTVINEPGIYRLIKEKR